MVNSTIYNILGKTSKPSTNINSTSSQANKESKASLLAAGEATEVKYLIRNLNKDVWVKSMMSQLLESISHMD